MHVPINIGIKHWHSTLAFNTGIQQSWSVHRSTEHEQGRTRTRRTEPNISYPRLRTIEQPNNAEQPNSRIRTVNTRIVHSWRRRMDGCVGASAVASWTDRLMLFWMDEWMNAWTDGWMCWCLGPGRRLGPTCSHGLLAIGTSYALVNHPPTAAGLRGRSLPT